MSARPWGTYRRCSHATDVSIGPGYCRSRRRGCGHSRCLRGLGDHAHGRPAAATSATTAPTPTEPASSGPAVTTKHDARLGTILADGNGLTLYTLTNNGKAVDC